jgi:hypothetical protein
MRNFMGLSYTHHVVILFFWEESVGARQLGEGQLYHSHQRKKKKEQKEKEKAKNITCAP